MRSRIPGILLLVILAFAGIAAWFVLPRAERAGGPLKLTRVSYADLPGWRLGEAGGALAAFRRSCAAILRAGPRASAAPLRSCDIRLPLSEQQSAE